MAKKFAVMYLTLMLATIPCFAKVDVNSVRIGLHEDKTRLVLELTDIDNFTILKSDRPEQIKIKLAKTAIPHKYMSKQKGKGHIVNYYFAPGPKGTTLLNIYSKKNAGLKSVFSMQKTKKQPFRIIADITPLKAMQKSVQKENTRLAIPLPMDKPLRKIVVIDAGHGGQDPGTISSDGTQEKDVTLAVAIEIKKIIDQSGKYTAILTRSADKHLPLRYRFSVAREMNANLFISLHADSNPNKNIRGISVYTLSENASDKEAQRLAEKENNSDFMEDLKFTQNADQDVKDILINLSQTRAKNHALDFANTLMKKFKQKEILLKNTHRAADFAVLKAPDVASVLIELGYLSNPSDQKRLVSKQYQVKIAGLIVSAINDYFEHVKS